MYCTSIKPPIICFNKVLGKLYREIEDRFTAIHNFKYFQRKNITYLRIVFNIFATSWQNKQIPFQYNF